MSPSQTPRTPSKNGTHVARPSIVNNTANSDTRGTVSREEFIQSMKEVCLSGFVMSFFSCLDEETRGRVDRLFTQWEAARLRVIVRDDNGQFTFDWTIDRSRLADKSVIVYESLTGRDHVIFLKHNEARLQDLREEVEKLCGISTGMQRILFEGMNQ